MPPNLEPAILMGSRFYFGMSAGDIHTLFSGMKVYNRRLFFFSYSNSTSVPCNIIDNLKYTVLSSDEICFSDVMGSLKM